jgi:hypothetical protein
MALSKKLRHSFNRVIESAEKLECKDLHHKKSHQHDSDFMCPALYELQRHVYLVKEYLKSA